MSEFWDQLFDRASAPPREVQVLPEGASELEAKLEALRRERDALEERVARAEIAFQALFTYLENKQVVNRNGFRMLVREASRGAGLEEAPAAGAEHTVIED